MVKKSVTQTLKNKSEKLEQDLQKLQKQKATLISKEKELVKSIKEVQAEYIVALMAESGKSIEELERFAQTNQSENGGDINVQNN